ncbi:MAG: hypothetical protein KIS96_11485 [Bauldia sp.]|nr:hypothetical protein [Bauldia sp.]
MSPPFREVERIRVGSWQLPAGAPTHEKCAALAGHLNNLCRTTAIGYAVLELPMSAPPARRKVVKETPLGLQVEEVAAGSIQAQTILWSLHGAAVAVLASWGVPFRTVAVSTWRKDVLGSGRLKNDEAKRLCREKLEARGVHVPNIDAAEGGALMIYAQRHYRRWQAEDEALRRSAAA